MTTSYENGAEEQARAEYANILELLKELERAEQAEAGIRRMYDVDDLEIARDAILDDPLSVTVRSGWVALGEPMVATEFEILLCWGGPAVRIRGELGDEAEPRRAWMEYQGWFTPWTLWGGADQAVLLAYASHFIYSD